MIKINNTAIRTCNNYSVNDFELDEKSVATTLPDITSLSIVGERDNMKLESFANFGLKHPINYVLDKKFYL